MAIFSFVKQAGALMADGLEAAANASATVTEATVEAVRSKIAESQIAARDLALKKVDDETIKVYAVVDSADDMEEIILLVGNTIGVAKVENAIKVKPEGQPEIVVKPPRFYTVKSGDTLGDIADRELGDSGRYMEIFNANRNILSNPDAIDVGQTLRIPQA